MSRAERRGEPFASGTRLAFLAERAARALEAPRSLTERDRAALYGAIELLESALAGEELIAKRDYSVAAGKSFVDLTWATSVLNTRGRSIAEDSPALSEVFTRFVTTIQEVLKDQKPDESRVQASREFFRALRDVVVSSSRRTTDIAEVPRARPAVAS